jgi:hypothetical protein
VEPAYALRDGRTTRADDHAEPGERARQPIEEVPGLRAQQRQVDHEGVHAHGDELLHPRGGLEPAVRPAEAFEAVDENAHEP